MLFFYFPRDGLLQSVPVNSFKITHHALAENTCQMKVSAALFQTDMSAQTCQPRDFKLRTKTQKRNEIKQDKSVLLESPGVDD